jgi:predicted ATPase
MSTTPDVRISSLFIGRDRELQVLREVLAEAREGTPRFHFLIGEAGVGKTRILEQFGREAAETGNLVLFGRCREAGTPFEPWIEVVRRCLDRLKEPSRTRLLGSSVADLSSLLPSPEPAVRTPGERDPVLAKRSIIEAVTRLLTGVRSPVSILLDDLQWADSASMELLEHLSSGLIDEPICVIATYRSDSLDHQPLLSSCGALVKLPGYGRTRVPALERDEVEELLRVATDRRLPTTTVDEIWNKTRGIALYVAEYARELVESPLRDGDRCPGLPDGVRGFIRRRFEKLPAECRRVLEAAALLGYGFDVGSVSQLIGLNAEVTSELLGFAVTRGIVTGDRDVIGRFRFYHPLIHEALRDEISPDDASRTHLAIAEYASRMFGVRADPQLLSVAAEHILAAGTDADFANVANLSIDAAREALRVGAVEHARTMVTRAIDRYRGEHDPFDRRLLASLYRLLVRVDVELAPAESAGHLETAFEIYSELGDVQEAVSVALTPIGGNLVVGDFRTRTLVYGHASHLLKRARARSAGNARGSASPLPLAPPRVRSRRFHRAKKR